MKTFEGEMFMTPNQTCPAVQKYKYDSEYSRISRRHEAKDCGYMKSVEICILSSPGLTKNFLISSMLVLGGGGFGLRREVETRSCCR